MLCQNLVCNLSRPLPIVLQYGFILAELTNLSNCALPQKREGELSPLTRIFQKWNRAIIPLRICVPHILR